jgi:hypothetical protein
MTKLLHIDVNQYTAGMAERISEGTFRHLKHDARIEQMEQVLFEAPLNTAMHFAKSLVTGSGKAKGQYEQARGGDYLMKEWQQYAARGAKPWTVKNVEDFFTRMFGQKISRVISQHVLQKNVSGQPAQPVEQPDQQQPDTAPGASPPPDTQSPAQTPTQTPQAPNAAPAGDQPKTYAQAQAEKANASATTQSPAPASTPASTPPGQVPTAANSNSPKQPAGGNAETKAQSLLNQKPTRNAAQLTSDLFQAGQANNPNKTQVMKLVQQLLQSTASDKDARQKAISNLKNMQDAWLAKIPELQQIDLSQFTESQIHRAGKLASYLIEHNISNVLIERAYDRLFKASLTEDDEQNTTQTTSNPSDPLQRVMTKVELEKKFKAIAAWLIDNNMMNVDSARTKIGNMWNAMRGNRQPNIGVNNSNIRDDGHSDHSDQHQFANQVVDKNKLWHAMEKNHVAMKDMHTVMQYLKSNMTADQLHAALEKSHVEVNGKVYRAIHQASIDSGGHH